jgi:transcriptional regulator with XRE-family HTH domain
MEDQRLGAVFRAVRIRKGWRQKDVAHPARVSPGLVSLIERGHVGAVSLNVLRRVVAVLDIRIELLARWRGGEIERLLNARHSALQDVVARWFDRLGGWTLAPEVSFAIYGERGWVDLLAWHAETATLLVIEIKTAIVDLQDLIGIVDRKVRLAPRIGRDRGWTPRVVASWVIVAEGATNRRRVGAHSALLRAAFPADGRAMRQWLRDPVERIAALSFFSYSTGDNVKREFAGRQRVRRPAGTAD